MDTEFFFFFFFFFMVELARSLVDSLFLWKSPWRWTKYWMNGVTCGLEYLERFFWTRLSWIQLFLLQMDRLQLTAVYCNRREVYSQDLGFQDKHKDYLQTNSPASTRPGFRMSCQIAARRGWDLFHIDLKTAFLQGQSHGENRDVACQLPPEAGHPPLIAARL